VISRLLRRSLQICPVADAPHAVAGAGVFRKTLQRAPVGAVVHQGEVEPDLERQPLARELIVERLREGLPGACLERTIGIAALQTARMAHEEVVIHCDDGPGARALRDHRQRELRYGAVLRHRRPARHRAGVVGEAVGLQSLEKTAACRQVWRAEADDFGLDERLPARRLMRNAVDLPRPGQDLRELAKLGRPL
jgi:hypothetical protein